MASAQQKLFLFSFQTPASVGIWLSATWLFCPPSSEQRKANTLKSSFGWKFGFVAQTYIIDNKIKVILKVWWFQTLFWALQIISCLVIIHFVVLPVSTQFCGPETEQCRQFAFYFPSSLFTAYTFPFLNSPAACMSVVDPLKPNCPGMQA